MANGGGSGVKLSDVFDEVWRIYEFLERCEEPTVSEKVQNEVASAVRQAERAVHMINDVNLFSDNEHIDEVATSELRYLLMPALLAYFTQKNTKMPRMEAVKKAQVYCVDYLRLIKMYAVADIEVPNLREEQEDEEQSSEKVPSRPGMPDLQAMQRQRDAKLARYKLQKENEAKLRELHTAVQAEHVDEEVKRDYYVMLLKKWVDTIQDDYDSITMEVPMLEHMAKMKSEGTNGMPRPVDAADHKPRKPFRPFILTKDKLQAQVFGAGYPSLPTYSVEEWYDMQIAQGKLPDQGMPANPAAQGPGAEQAQREAEAAKKEDAEETDDADALRKAREWDDWKDDHRRGWGNRQNMG